MNYHVQCDTSQQIIKSLNLIVDHYAQKYEKKTLFWEFGTAFAYSLERFERPNERVPHLYYRRDINVRNDDLNAKTHIRSYLNEDMCQLSTRRSYNKGHYFYIDAFMLCQVQVERRLLSIRPEPLSPDYPLADIS